MNELRPEARSVVEAARGAESLSREDRARIKRGVLMQVVAVGATTTAAGSAVAMSLATKITLVGLTVAALGGGAVSVRSWKHHQPATVDHHPTATARPAAVVAGPATEARPAPEETPLPARVAEPKRHDNVGKNLPRRPSSAGASVIENSPPAPNTVESLNPELTVLRQAQDDLRAGLPAQALRRLQDFDQRFGPGSLGQERRAIAAIALCQVHPGPAAQARAEAFLHSTPESPLAGRVRTACAKAIGPAKQVNESEGGREP